MRKRDGQCVTPVRSRHPDADALDHEGQGPSTRASWVKPAFFSRKRGPYYSVNDNVSRPYGKSCQPHQPPQHPAPELGETLDQAAQSLEALLAQARADAREGCRGGARRCGATRSRTAWAPHGAGLARHLCPVGTRTLQLLRAVDRRGALQVPWRRMLSAHPAPANIAPRRSTASPDEPGARSCAFPLSASTMARSPASTPPPPPPAIAALIDDGITAENARSLVALMQQSSGTATYGDPGLDETLEAIRSEMRRFSQAEVEPHAHHWHEQNAYIPMEVINQMAELGVFGLTIPEEFGGMGLTRSRLCVVSEEIVPAAISGSAPSAHAPRSRQS